jgi:Tfp pilus assembly protein PilF
MQSIIFDDRHGQRRRQTSFETLQGLIVVWLNIDLNQNVDQLRLILSNLKIFNSSDECVDFITNAKQEKVFMIISSEFPFKYMVSILHQFPQLETFYIYDDGNNSEKDLWENEWRKVKGTFTTVSSICDRLKHDIKQCELDLTPISFLPFASSTSTDLNELNQSFMYSQLLTEILLDMNHDEQDKKRFVDFCRLQTDNNYELHVINEFERDYECHSPIWWYTKESFIYYTLNKALRTQDNQILIKMAFFIRDLYQQIKQLHSKTDNQNLLTVFRGQGILNDEFDQLQHKGGLISFNSFLSTSLDRQVSCMYADSARDNPQQIGILFRMEINPNIGSSPFASLDKISYYSDSEKEILFSMHSVFRIGEMNEIDQGLWQVSLTLTSDDDPQLRCLTDHMRQDIEGTGLLRLGQLMIKMNDLRKAQDIYETILEMTKNNDKEQIAFVHHQLGEIYYQMSDFSNSLTHYHQSLDIVSDDLPIDHPSFSPTYNNIGLILQEQGKFDEALKYLKHALAIDLHATNVNRQYVAIRYNNIGMVLHAQGKYAEALDNYEKALKIELADLPPLHPTLAIAYNNIGMLHFSMKNYSNALLFYQKTLEIKRRSLPPHHSSLAVTYSNIATVLEDLRRFDEGIEYAQQAVNIYQRTFSVTDSQMQIFQNHLDRLRQHP